MIHVKTTPMMQQYLAIKNTYPDALLFYRMGDFYEMFFEDAEIASPILDIALTSRNKKEETPVPMCGVPCRAVQNYIGRLIDRGFKVAICDQVEDAAEAKGLVKRDVVRVITPGTIVETELLDAKTDNNILAISRHEQTTGLAYLDISTGIFRLSESQDVGGMVDETLRIAPSEIIFPDRAQGDPQYAPLVRALAGKATTFLPDGVFEFRRGRETLLDQLGVRSLEGFGCEDRKAGVSAAGALLYYVRETQKQKIGHLSRVESYTIDSHLVIDDPSWRNLELTRNIRSGARQGTLIDILDRTLTPMGGRLLQRWLRYPLKDAVEIGDRHDAVEEARNHIPVRRSLRECLKSVYDLERLGSKIAMGRASARDLVSLKRSLNMLPRLQALLAPLQARCLAWEDPLDTLTELADLIERAIREDAPPTLNEGGLIREGFDPELDRLIGISRDGKGWLARLEAAEKEATAINSLKVRYNKVFGYYIEVSKTYADAVPAHYIRKQTLVNAERYITDELKSFEATVLGAEERRAALEYQLFTGIREKVTARNETVQRVARFVGRLDCLLSLAEVADQNGYCRPEINQAGTLSIEEGRHPVVEKMISGERFVPNTIHLDNSDHQVLIITGPNMAGKSTVLRQVALTVLLAQVGSFVPARKASLGITDRIFTRVGALDNLSQGQSTFMVEMEETANILNNATQDSLVIMDEIGRGTSTFDGLSIAWAVAEYLHDLKGKGVKTLFATHYHELTELAETRPRVKNYNIAVKEWNDEIIFLRKLVEGGTNRSYGIQVARLAGIPREVVERAKQILAAIENGDHRAPGLPLLGDALENRPPKPVQLSLFQQPNHRIIEKLQTVDIGRLTPLEALNFLNNLQEQTKAAAAR